MKKLFTLFVVIGMTALIACGPSAEEKAAKEKAKQDSIAAALVADSIAQAEIAKAKADSIAAVAVADSIAKAAAEAKPVKKGKK